MSLPPRGRYAPSPTGDLHLGNASSALLAWLSIRAAGGRFVLRVEDLDAPRTRPGAAARILEDLAWLGIDWDEGPDRGGPFAPYEQSGRAGLYRDAFERLRQRGRAYPCFCSRRDVLASASAPQEAGDEVRYPGTCRGLGELESARHVEQGRQCAFRFRVEGEEPIPFADRVRGDQRPGPPGDFVLLRADGVAAYQLAVVVDDAAMQITEVVRGGDLLASTARQILVYRALGLSEPAFAHLPLLVGQDGVRLSKRHRGTSLRELREGGADPGAVVGFLAHLVGILPRRGSVAPRALVEGFDLSRLATSPMILRVDTLPATRVRAPG